MKTCFLDDCPEDAPFPHDNKRKCCETNVRDSKCPNGLGPLLETDPPNCCDQSVNCTTTVCNQPWNVTGLRYYEEKNGKLSIFSVM